MGFKKILTMEKENTTKSEKITGLFLKFEQIISVGLSVIIAMIIIISLLRIVQNFYELFISDIFSLEKIMFDDYLQLFGYIMTLLISLEFMSSIIKVLKSHDVKTLTLDVVLITALAITRKLIIYDYDHHEPISILAFAGLLLSLGVFYFLINYKKDKKDKNNKAEIDI
jgi:uncharacterized membrane protein (DUF373 family)